MMLLKLKALVARLSFHALVISICLVVGFYAGWREKTVRMQAAETKQLQEVRKTDAKAIAEMQKKETKILVKKEETEERIKVITKEVVKYVPKTVYVDREVVTVRPADCGSDTLTVDAVRLLNAARQNAAIDPASLGHAESQAAAEGRAQGD